MRRPARVLSTLIISVVVALSGSPIAGAESNWTTEKITGHTVWYQNFSRPPMLPGPNTADEEKQLPNHQFAHIHVEVARWDGNDVPIIFVSDTCFVETFDPNKVSTTCTSLTPGELTWITEDKARQVSSNTLINGLIAKARNQCHTIRSYGLRVFVAG